MIGRPQCSLSPVIPILLQWTAIQKNCEIKHLVWSINTEPIVKPMEHYTELYLCDRADELAGLCAGAGDAAPVRPRRVHQLGVARHTRHQVAALRRALRAPDAAEHGAELRVVAAPRARAHEVLGLS